MSIGIIMKGLNSLYFRHMLDFYFEFIPMFLFLFALFGWMDILIIGKWLEPKNTEGIYMPNTNTTNLDEIRKFNEIHLSPAIITTMIDIFLNGASNLNKVVANSTVLNQSGIDYNYVVGSQKLISTIFLLLALACAPIMLFVKPMILKR
jgi:V-type H+-transporting ATPase subunit a